MNNIINTNEQNSIFTVILIYIRFYDYARKTNLGKYT